MIGGNTSFGSGGWDQTVWDGLIPVDMSGRGHDRSENYWGTFRVVIPPKAMEHPIWRIVDDPERNRQVLARFLLFMDQPDRSLEAGRHRPRAFAGAAAGSASDRIFMPDVRKRPDIRHVERHNRRLGPRLRE